MEKKYRIVQIEKPRKDDTDPHPNLRIDGDPIYPGQTFLIFTGSRWDFARLECWSDIKGVESWYFVGYEPISPVGLFVRVEI